MSGIVSTLFRKPPVALSLTDASEWSALGLHQPTASGVNVTPDNGLIYTAVYACVRVLAESVAGLPLITYQRQGSRKARARDFYLYRLLHDQPNPLMSSFEFRETLMGHLLTWGNGYAEIEYSGGGQVAALWPLNPAKMQSVKVVNGEMEYKYELPNGRVSPLPGWRVWHLRGLGGDGLMGYSPIRLARQSIGLGLAAEEYGARFFGNGAKPGGVLQHPGTLGDQAHNHLRDSWSETHGGLANSHRVAILEEGMTYQQIGIPPEDAQFLETRKFQRAEIAGIYRVPPHMIADLEHATFSNIEHQAIEFVTHSLRPWLVRWEQGINNSLMSTGEQTQYYAEFLVDALLRGDVLSRFQAYAVARQWGWMSADDVRSKENENPLPGGQGETYLTPLNMIPADEVGEGVASAASGHYRLLAEEAAGRVVRKEMAAMTKASERAGDSRAMWGTAVLDFYADHAEFVSQVMRMPLADALLYTAVNQTELLNDGPGVMADWLTRRVVDLAALATLEAAHD